MKTKIYISKSNRSNPDDESWVRQVLSDFNDVEIVEYRGGLRNLDKVKDCDYLIILPNEIDEFCDPTNEGGLSLGQYEEWCAFRKANYSTHEGNTLVVTETNQFHVTVKTIVSEDISDDEFNHLYIGYRENENSLRNLLEDRLGYQAGESFYKESKKSNYYLLIS